MPKNRKRQFPEETLKVEKHMKRWSTAASLGIRET